MSLSLDKELKKLRDYWLVSSERAIATYNAVYKLYR